MRIHDELRATFRRRQLFYGFIDNAWKMGDVSFEAAIGEQGSRLTGASRVVTRLQPAADQHLPFAEVPIAEVLPVYVKQGDYDGVALRDPAMNFWWGFAGHRLLNSKWVPFHTALELPTTPIYLVDHLDYGELNRNDVEYLRAAMIDHMDLDENAGAFCLSMLRKRDADQEAESNRLHFESVANNKSNPNWGLF